MLLNYLIRHTKIRRYILVFQTIIYSVFSNFEPILHRFSDVLLNIL